ncbi:MULTISPECIES: secA translation cis-regulator SecM [Tatumella]|uniref:Secretion monitor n=1 Tax=Tatumella punctata TaxID=399969 RepID=A0ABW1VRA9_9GAMM|nr:secA regulator SecM [Tatumella sp. JGM16]MBS0877439.1 secA regulator SecM [Tatumella sp. JGM82]MBS0891019.1 secA regulator SecM [Tatumella sp. JGM94]MBS0895186.1 secA regulator SecM [Tatumella sp. JGM130]MBS0902033.1 secA regulator SecM [Tatumella sp. JGM100]MBS0913128.1 secA regulator SecM [Tatumella sp. JGM91]
MIGIFARWRQLGMRYFWPHLLLGMVAASLGLPVANAQVVESGNGTDVPANTLFIGHAARFENLLRIRDTVRRPGLSVDYWHQHAIRVVIRHLSFSLPQLQPEAQQQLLPLTVQKIAVLQSLHALLTNGRPAVSPSPGRTLIYTGKLAVFNSGLWLAGVQGIRAGPVSV